MSWKPELDEPARRAAMAAKPPMAEDRAAEFRLPTVRVIEGSGGGGSVKTLPELAPGQSLGLALGLSTVPNLRDVGGYATRESGIVARGIAYRSDAFHPLSAEDVMRLERLGLKNNYDLRTEAEAEARPDQLPAGVRSHRLDVLADDQRAVVATIEAALRQPTKANDLLGGGRIEAMFEQVYREFIRLPSARQAYRALFLGLVDPQSAPVVFHCTTGKDRTGWAAASLLTLLGVQADAVMTDYLRTNEYTLPLYGPMIDAFVAAGGARPIAQAALGVKPDYLEASFAEMERLHGTIEAYFADALGIDRAGQRALRQRFLGAA